MRLLNWRRDVWMVPGAARLRKAVRTAVAALIMSGAAASVFAAELPIRIGAPLPLTGALSPEGVKLQQGYELWKDTVNAAGGIAVGAVKRPIEIIGGQRIEDVFLWNDFLSAARIL